MPQPICIITASGMICASSKPMRFHSGHGTPACTDKPGPSGKNDKIVSDVVGVLKANQVPPDTADTMGTVIQVMLESGLDHKAAFTIHGHM